MPNSLRSFPLYWVLTLSVSLYLPLCYFIRNILTPLPLKNWNIFACTNCDCSSLYTNYKFFYIILSWKLHWGYSVMKTVGQWFDRLGHVVKIHSGLWIGKYNFIKFITSRLQLCSLYDDISKKKLHTKMYFREKHGVIYWLYLATDNVM